MRQVAPVRPRRKGGAVRVTDASADDLDFAVGSDYLHTNGDVFTKAELTRLVQIEAAARNAPEIVGLLSQAEGSGSERLNEAKLLTWMETVARIQLIIVSTALQSRTAGNDIANHGFDIPPDFIVSGINSYVNGVLAAPPGNEPWRPQRARHTPMSAATTDQSAGVLCDASEVEFEGLKELRSAGYRHADLKEIGIQFKYNRCWEGSLRNGDDAPDVPLHPVLFNADGAACPGAPVTLHELVRATPSQPLCVIAGSYS